MTCEPGRLSTRSKTIDEKWRNHLLGMDQLREGIGLRAYGQKNPLIEYKSEAYNFFQELMISLRSIVLQRVFHILALRIPY